MSFCSCCQNNDLCYQGGNQKITSIDSPAHPFTYQHWHPSFLFYLPSDKPSVQPVKAYPSTLLTGSIFFHKIKGFVPVILLFLSYIIKCPLSTSLFLQHANMLLCVQSKKKSFSWPHFSFQLPSCVFASICSKTPWKNCEHSLSLILVSDFSLSQTQSSQLCTLPLIQNCLSRSPMTFMLLNPKGQLSILIFLHASVAFDLTNYPSSLIHFFTRLPGHHTLWFSSYPIGFFVWGSVVFPSSLPDLLL